MPLNRRKFLGKSAATGAAVALTGAVSAPAAQAHGGRPKGHKRYSFTVMGTTDLHGHVFNWDYFKDAEYSDPAGNAMGLSRISTLVEEIRAERAAQHAADRRG